MRLQGRLIRDGKYWLAEIPVFDAMTQGRSRKEAYAMAKDLVEALAGVEGFQVTIFPTDRNTFEIGSSDIKVLIALFLRRHREANGYTLQQMAERMGAKSKNAYARYEQGLSVPTIEKFDTLFRAVSPHRDFLLVATPV